MSYEISFLIHVCTFNAVTTCQSLIYQYNITIINTSVVEKTLYLWYAARTWWFLYWTLRTTGIPKIHYTCSAHFSCIREVSPPSLDRKLNSPKCEEATTTAEEQGPSTSGWYNLRRTSTLRHGDGGSSWAKLSTISPPKDKAVRHGKRSFRSSPGLVGQWNSVAIMECQKYPIASY